MNWLLLTEVLKRFREEHWGIYKAIENQNAVEANQLMAAHLNNAQLELGLLKAEI